MTERRSKAIVFSEDRRRRSNSKIPLKTCPINCNQSSHLLHQQQSIAWLHKDVSCSFDGASVNTGESNEMISLFQDIAPWILLIHAIAHGVELAADAGFNAVPYFKDSLEPTMRKTVAAYHMSGKKQWNVVRISR